VDAEDITQDIFLSLWEQRKTIQLRGRLFSYVYSMARFKTYKYIREKNLTGSYQQQWESWLEKETEPVTEPEAFRLSDMKALESDMSREITALPPQMKRIYRLNIEEGLSISDTARHLNISEHTVKKHLVNIKKRLRTFIALRLFFFLSCLCVLLFSAW
jgi:RNA polymerase sigma-70 factor (ECF subfamily)